MTELFKVYHGDRLPDFSSPILITAVIEYGETTRTERFLLSSQKVKRDASRYKWSSQGFEIKPMVNAARLEQVELDQGTRTILEEIGKLDSAEVKALYRNFNFSEVEDPKTFLITEQLMGRLPPLKEVKGSRCRQLKQLIDFVAAIAPITPDDSVGDWL